MPSAGLAERPQSKKSENHKGRRKENFFILSPEQLSEVRFKTVKVSAIATIILSAIFLGIFGLTYSSIKQKAFQSASASFREQEKSMKAQADQSRAQIEQYQKELVRMREQIQTYTSARETVKKELDESYSKISELWKSIRMMEELLGKTLTAQVMRVNRSLRYVIINLGLRDQIKMGDKLTVERDGKTIGSLEIQKLYDRFSAANILQESKETPIREGDAIQSPAPEARKAKP